MIVNRAPDYELGDSRIDIWCCESESLHDPCSSFLSVLSSEEKNRAKRFKFDTHRNQFIFFHGFMRIVLSRYLKIEPRIINYVKGEKGKPFIDKQCCNAQTLQFNLSHTHNVALLAVTKNKDVGIDIEHMERNANWRGICQRFFTESEQQSLFSLDEWQQEQAFYKLWTRKEAYMKVLGTGLSLSPTEFTLTVPPEEPELIKHHSSKIQGREGIEFIEISLPKSMSQYCATLAHSGPVSDSHLYQFS